MRAFRADLLVASLGCGIVALHTLAFVVPPGALWGADAYVFLPWPILPLAALALAACVALAWRRTGALREPPRAPGHVTLLRAAAWVAAFATLFWVGRCEHLLLGDGIPLTRTLAADRSVHPREPLTMFVQQRLHAALAPALTRPGMTAAAVARDVVAIGSVLLGAGFVALAMGLSRELARAFGASGGGSLLALAMFALLVAQGYMQVFFGYVENYALPACAAALFLLASLRFLRGEGPVAWPIAALLFAVASHLGLLVLAPPLLVVLGAGLADPRRRATVAATVGAFAAAGMALLWAAQVRGANPGVLADAFRAARAAPGYLFSAAHLRDYASEQVLIGPFGAWLLAPLLLAAAWLRPRPVGATLFLSVAGGSAGLVCLLAPDLPLGYPRDWDLFTPLGVIQTVAALGLLGAVPDEARTRLRAIAVAAAVSVFHTGAWVALNHSEHRSVARFATLPIGDGRVESTIAFWHHERGEREQAKHWLAKSLAKHPENVRALEQVGRIALEEGDPRRASRAFLIMLTIQPTRAEFLRLLETAAASAGGGDAVLAQIDTLLLVQPENGGLWYQRARWLAVSGRSPEAAAAHARAIALWPVLARLPAPALPAAGPEAARPESVRIALPR